MNGRIAGGDDIHGWRRLNAGTSPRKLGPRRPRLALALAILCACDPLQVPLEPEDPGCLDCASGGTLRIVVKVEPEVTHAVAEVSRSGTGDTEPDDPPTVALTVDPLAGMATTTLQQVPAGEYEITVETFAAPAPSVALYRGSAYVAVAEHETSTAVPSLEAAFGVVRVRAQMPALLPDFDWDRFDWDRLGKLVVSGPPGEPSYFFELFWFEAGHYGIAEARIPFGFDRRFEVRQAVPGGPPLIGTAGMDVLEEKSNLHIQLEAR